RQLTIRETTPGDVAMKRFFRNCLLVVLLVIGFATRLSGQQVGPADFVLLGGKVYTLDAKDTVAQAVAIHGGKIVLVGSDDQAKALVGPKTEVFKAGGRVVGPGLSETHVHPTGAASGEVNLPFTQLHSIGEIQDWVRKQVAATPRDRRTHAAARYCDT